MFDVISVAPAVTNWELAGPAGVHLDKLLSLGIQAGCAAERIADGRYRLVGGPAEFIEAYAVEIAQVEGFRLAHEVPPLGTTIATATVEPERRYRRTTFLHGPAFAMVARAVDRGLRVTGAGSQRWAIAGSTAAQVAWWAAVREITNGEALQQWGLTADQAKTEDASLSISVPVSVEIPLRVELPTRRTITQSIDRDAAGNIVEVTSLEKDA